MEEWLESKRVLNKYLHMGTNVIMFRGWNLTKIIDYMRLVKHIKGKYNVIEMGENVELDRAVLNISGNYNHVTWGDEVSIIDTEFRIDDSNNKIYIGKGTYIYKASIMVGEKTIITIGEDCLFAQDVTIRSIDGHKIFNMDKSARQNKSLDIWIGNHVWLAKGCNILKGAYIGNDVVVATCAVVNKKIAKDNCIIGGIPARVLKEDIIWEY